MSISPRKSYFSSICASFLPRNFPLYGIASSLLSSGWLDQRKRSTFSAALVMPIARCGWLAILRGWAGEPCKIRVSPEKSGWVGRSGLSRPSNHCHNQHSPHCSCLTPKFLVQGHKNFNCCLKQAGKSAASFALCMQTLKPYHAQQPCIPSLVYSML